MRQLYLGTCAFHFFVSVCLSQAIWLQEYFTLYEKEESPVRNLKSFSEMSYTGYAQSTVKR